MSKIILLGLKISETSKRVRPPKITRGTWQEIITEFSKKKAQHRWVRNIAVIISYLTLTVKHKIVYFCRRFQCLILLRIFHLFETFWRVCIKSVRLCSIHTGISAIRKPLNVWGYDSYTVQTLACTKTSLRQVNKCISYKRTVILDVVLSETSVVCKEHANCLINVIFHVRFIHVISKFYLCNICFVFCVHFLIVMHYWLLFFVTLR